MSLEYEAHEDGVQAEAKDYTKWVWGGVIVLFVVAAAAIFFQGRPSANVSMVRASHILIRVDGLEPVRRQQALELAQDIRRQLVEGADFRELARKYSQDPYSSRRGGDLGWQRLGSFAENFEAAVWTLPLNTLSDVVETGHGYHLIVVHDRVVADADRPRLERFLPEEERQAS